MPQALGGAARMNGATQQLARFVAASRWSDVPRNVQHEAARAIMNWLGCAIGGCRDRTVEVMVAALRDFSGPPQASLLGRGERFDALTAACINGTSSNRLDFDDTHLRTVIHPSVPIASALAALAEYRPLTGAGFLHAFVLGVEVECRVGNAIAPEHYDRGWHITATCGVLGAAAAAAKALELDAHRIASAIGIAATQASGLMEMLGTMCKSYNMGHAARNGLSAAFLAEAGFTSSPRALEAPRGFLNVLAARNDEAEITTDLGSRWELTHNAYKPYPCGIVIHPVIDGCLELRQEQRIDPPAIVAIEVDVNPLAQTLCGRKTPRDSLEGKLSLYHSAAVALLDGEAGVRQYLDERVRASDVAVLREKVVVNTDAAIATDQARIRVALANGASHETFVEHARGSLARPLTDAELEAKFRALAAAELSPPRIDRLAEQCWSLERQADASVIARGSFSG
ncbi:MAG: MmgE/PrpD family protein [Burkholderiales bacterium]|nr:MmgE/PrpD family protein [Burkholderiales bacterium]